MQGPKRSSLQAVFGLGLRCDTLPIPSTIVAIITRILTVINLWLDYSNHTRRAQSANVSASTAFGMNGNLPRRLSRCARLGKSRGVGYRVCDCRRVTPVGRTYEISMC